MEQQQKKPKLIVGPPWKHRGRRKLEVVRRYHENRQGKKILYHEMSDGSIRRLDSGREVRKILGLSPRQHRKAKRAERQQKGTQ